MKIQPPFEDLFDAAEEYILLLLLEPWTKMIKSDQVAYGKVQWHWSAVCTPLRFTAKLMAGNMPTCREKLRRSPVGQELRVKI